MAMPQLLYGTAWKQEKTKDLVVKALSMGFRGVDTACQPKHYHEMGVGAALSAVKNKIPRKEIFVQTKFTPLAGQDPKRVPYDPNAPIEKQVEQSFATSLENLQSKYVDSLVLHSPLGNPEQTRKVWQAMEKICKREGARQIGISNCYDLSTLQQLFQEAEIKPTVVQNRFYRDTNYDTPLRAWCRENGITYQSFWTLTANPDILQGQTMAMLSKGLSRTPAQILFRYLIQKGVVPITGTSSEEHMKEDLSVLTFELDKETMVACDKLFI